MFKGTTKIAPVFLAYHSAEVRLSSEHHAQCGNHCCVAGARSADTCCCGQCLSWPTFDDSLPALTSLPTYFSLFLGGKSVDAVSKYSVVLQNYWMDYLLQHDFFNHEPFMWFRAENFQNVTHLDCRTSLLQISDGLFKQEIEKMVESDWWKELQRHEANIFFTTYVSMNCNFVALSPFLHSIKDDVFLDYMKLALNEGRRRALRREAKSLFGLQMLCQEAKEYHCEREVKQAIKDRDGDRLCDILSGHTKLQKDVQEWRKIKAERCRKLLAKHHDHFIRVRRNIVNVNHSDEIAKELHNAQSSLYEECWNSFHLHEECLRKALRFYPLPVEKNLSKPHSKPSIEVSIVSLEQEERARKRFVYEQKIGMLDVAESLRNALRKQLDAQLDETAKKIDFLEQAVPLMNRISTLTKFSPPSEMMVYVKAQNLLALQQMLQTLEKAEAKKNLLAGYETRAKVLEKEDQSEALALIRRLGHHLSEREQRKTEYALEQLLKRAEK